MSQKVEPVTATHKTHNGDPAFDLPMLEEWYGPGVELPGNCLLFTKVTEYWVDYALMQFAEDDGITSLYVNVFSGRGTGPGLREMRHTYFGTEFNGYCFYLPINAVQQALELLKQHFEE